MGIYDLNIAQERAYPTPYSNSPWLPLLLFILSFQKHSPKRNVKESVGQLKLEYDYIIVGAGSAGSVVARRLSEKPCVTVLLLEAGKPPPRLAEIPAIARCFFDTDIDWQYFTTPQKHAGAGHNDRIITWPSGKSLGGSSTFNAMLYVRGNRRNYDEWSKMGAKGWSYAECLPYFKKLEDNKEYLGNGSYHATRGPITVSRPSYYPKKKLSAMKAIRDEGYDFVNPNAEEQIGFFDLQGSIRRGQRCSTAKAYLVPADKYPNLDILPNAMVRKVLIENKRAIGVEFDFDGETHHVMAKKEVIMSAGATNTPQLLMLSGIGPESELSKHNISVIEALPVGLNLQDHPAAILPFLVDDKLPRFENEVRKPMKLLAYTSTRTGTLSSTEGVLLMSFLSNEENGTENIPDHSVYLSDFLDITFFQGNLNQEVIQEVLLPLANKSTITCTVQLLRPRSRGTVTLRSADPLAAPVIDPNYYEHPQDVNDMVQGMKVCLRIMNNPAMKEIGARAPDVVVPGCGAFATNVNQYFECVAKAIIFTTSHPVGTAKMGDPSDPTTVVDPELRVKGIQGLRVVDASIMPTVPWSNTNIPTIMVAEKASDIIKNTTQC